MAKAFDIPQKRKLPKLMACMTKNSVENMRNKALFNLNTLDAKGIRRHKLPLHECIELELKEAGFFESSDYLQDLIYDNIQILAEDDIGIVIDIRKREDYLEHICAGLQRAERERDRENKKKECLELLNLALYYSEQGKGILWLAEKFFLAAIAVASHYLQDGGRQKACCKYHYASFLLNKFPDTEDMEEAYAIFSDIRDSAIGKDWPLFENDNEVTEALKGAPNSVFIVTVLELHKILMSKARAVRAEDPAKAERLSRLAQRRAKDAADVPKAAEAIIEIGISQLAMNSLNNAQKSFQKAYKIYEANNDIIGLCVSKMHLAAVKQRLGDHETSAKLLTEMGALAMQHGLRRHLGRALHLLGELHLKRERPDLGTQHLEEAFMCFMGYIVQDQNYDVDNRSSTLYADIDTIYKTQKQEVLDEEAEQSRVMMAISAGQELMASYFKILEEAAECTVAKVKVIEWKSSKGGWWLDHHRHKFIPCPCPTHRRTPLDVLWMRLNERERSTKSLLEDETKTEQVLQRGVTIEDMRLLRSSSVK